MNKGKLQKVYDFFDQERVELPIDVHNAIEDVFNENEGVDDVEIYFKEDAEVYESDLVLTNKVEVYFGLPSKGQNNNVFTYYGEIDWSLSEFVNLYDKDNNLLQEITNIDNSEMASALNKEKFAVVLIELVTWEKDILNKKMKLYIYCPENPKQE